MLAWLIKNNNSVVTFVTAQIKVSNSALISAFMTELEADSPVAQVIYLNFRYLKEGKKPVLPCTFFSY